jgi:hypothetical protein
MEMETKKEYDVKSLTYKGARVSANFERPTGRHKMRYNSMLFPILKDADKMQKIIARGEIEALDVDKTTEVMRRLQDLDCSILLDLHDKGVFKTIDDLYDVASEDMDALVKWFKEKAGIENDKQREAFLSTSAK